MLYKQRSVIVVIFHVGLIAASAVFAWLLRFDFSLCLPRVLLSYLPVLLVFRIAALGRFGLLHGYWRHSSMNEIVNIAKAVALGSVACFVVARCDGSGRLIPSSIFLLEAITTSGALLGVRLAAIARERRTQAKQMGSRRQRVIVVGAGGGAALLLGELARSEFLPAACVDDDRFKHGARICGVPVVGSVDDIEKVAAAYRAEQIFIAIPSATRAEIRRISTLCGRTGLACRIVPNLRDLLAGRLLVSQLRDIRVEDLLGRDPVHLDFTAVRRRLEGKVVMVTGAAGSIGSELCRQVLNESPARLIALDQAETPLFYLQLQLTKEHGGKSVIYAVEDVANTSRMQQLLEREKVDVLFHAAAYKHVPMVEANIRPALSNNVFAVQSLLDAAEKSGCGSFVLISTDKAVHPTSFMGATKRLGELMMAARRPGTMRSVAVRFGNVLGSQGSVIPVFKEQIEKEGRVTITHPDVTRYFMTIPEAVSLVLQAFTIGAHGDILVLDMGSPVRILDLAHSLIRMCGKAPGEVRIDITGLRPGEKLHEELFYAREEQIATGHSKVKRTRSDIIPQALLAARLEDLASLVRTGTEASIRAKIREIIPEYTSWAAAPRLERTAREGKAISPAPLSETAVLEGQMVDMPALARAALASGGGAALSP